MLHIFGKNECNLKTLNQACEEGFTNIELQLLKDFKDTPVFQYVDILKNIPQLKVHSVHPPIIDGYACDFADMLDSHKKVLIYKSAHLADTLADLYGFSIPIVVHTMFGYEFLTRYSDLFRHLVDEVSNLLTTFPKIEISIENTIPLYYDKSTKTIGTRGTDAWDNIKIAQRLREILNTDRVSVVVDTCHLLATLRIKQASAKLFDEYVQTEDVSTYFSQAGNLVRIVHLANCIGYGFGKGKHGASFSSDSELDKEILSIICSDIQTYCPEANCVLENFEEDYTPGYSNKNKLLTLKTLGELGYSYVIGC